MCKYGDVFSLAVLIDRGLDLIVCMPQMQKRLTECTISFRSVFLAFFFWIPFVQFSGYDPETVSVYSGEGTPVPIPNTAVKLTNAEDTWLEAARENR